MVDKGEPGLIFNRQSYWELGRQIDDSKLRKGEPPLSSTSRVFALFRKKILTASLVIALAFLAFAQTLPASGQSAPDFNMSVSNQNVTLSGQFEHDDDLFFTSLNGFAGVVNITVSSPYPCGDGVIATAPRGSLRGALPRYPRLLRLTAAA